jgi:hypothetical protein
MSSMARQRAKAKNSTINRATPALLSLLEHYCRGLDGWARSWMGWEKDLPTGEKLVACFRPFVEDLIASDLSPKNHSEAHRQPVGIRRENHPRPE